MQGAPRPVITLDGFKPDHSRAVLTNTEAAYLSADTSGRTIIDKIFLTELTGVAKTATLRVYPTTALSNSANYNIFMAVPLAANETVVLDGPIYLANGGTLACLASANSAVAININYRKEQ